MNGKSEKLANFEKLVNENKGKTMYQLIDERREELKKEKFPFKLGSEGWYIDYDKRKVRRALLYGCISTIFGLSADAKSMDTETYAIYIDENDVRHIDDNDFVCINKEMAEEILEEWIGEQDDEL